ncbi:hypothetical protein DNTS_009501, partial [Danionella cerebrum]
LNVTLRGSESPCEGRLEVYGGHNGISQWGLVCYSGWRRENAEVVCRSLGCGDPVRSGLENTLYKDQLLPKLYLMDQVKCTSEEESLWKCPFVGARVVNCKEGSFVAVKCSGDVKLRLNLNGQTDRCAGVVEFTTHDGIFGVCNSNWDKSKADMICQEIGCGNHSYIPKPGLFKGEPTNHNVLLNCSGNGRFSWQCMERTTNCLDQASVICSEHKKFRLKGSSACSGSVEEFDVQNKSWVPLRKEMRPDEICKQLNCGHNGNLTSYNESNILMCSDTITLRNFTSKCFGEVFVVVNDTEFGVCSASDQTLSRQLGVVVCRELACGEVLDVKAGRVVSNGLLSNVECQGDEEFLWQCLAKRERKHCNVITVVCSGSLDLHLRDGLGRCSGRLEVSWEGSWRSIRSSDWTTANSDMVCQHLSCGKSIPMPKELFVNGKQRELDWNLQCRHSSAKLHECFLKKRSKSENAPVIKVICQAEELLFFEGNTPCRGKVRITSFDGAEPENKKNVSGICHAMQCGNLVSIQTEPNSTYVTCSGSVDVNLRNSRDERCWGTVEVCRGDGCGGVCKNTWTGQESSMVCMDLGCGSPLQGQLKLETEYTEPVRDYSVYCPEGSIKARLEDPRDKCAGKVSLFFAGHWKPVCRESLNQNFYNAVCKELNCGEYEPSVTPRDEPQTKGLVGIQCQENTNSVSECDLKSISWGVRQCTPSYLTCTGRTRLLLYKPEGQCKGPVYMYAQKQTLLVSGQGWGTEEGQKMCTYLQCGDYIKHSVSEISKDGLSKLWNSTYNCSGKDTMWECERHGPLVQLQHQVNIECDGQPAVRLSNDCRGTVLINNETVCASQWNNHMSDDLCNSLGCGKAVHQWSTGVSVGDHWDLSCTGMESLLWQCGPRKNR